MRESLLSNLKTYLLIYFNVLVSYRSDLSLVVIAIWYQLGEGACFGELRQNSHCKNNAVGVAVLRVLHSAKNLKQKPINCSVFVRACGSL